MSITPSPNLQDQKALVTGATSGPGRVIALPLARDGAQVIVHGRDSVIASDGGRMAISRQRPLRDVREQT